MHKHESELKQNKHNILVSPEGMRSCGRLFGLWTVLFYCFEAQLTYEMDIGYIILV